MDELCRALEGEDAASLVAAIERAASTLARLEVIDPRAEALGRAVARHARHERATVREAVAEAAVDFPDAIFEEVISDLEKDPSRYVRRSARQSSDARSRRSRIERAREEASADLQALRAAIAEHKPAAARLADRYKDLAVAQFADRLQHELAKAATPLRIGLGLMAMEVQKPASALLPGQVADASAALKVVLEIARSARVYAEVATPSFREEDLRAIVDEQVTLLRGRAGDRAERLVVEVAVEPQTGVEVDRALFGQAVANLLQNALEAYRAEHTGEVVIRVSSESRRGGTLVALVVEDRGRGIRPEEIAHLGRLFVSSKGTGRGLGMANLKKVVEGVHGGSVEIASEWGEGTRVGVVVPRRQRG